MLHKLLEVPGDETVAAFALLIGLAVSDGISIEGSEWLFRAAIHLDTKLEEKLVIGRSH